MSPLDLLAAEAGSAGIAPLVACLILLAATFVLVILEVLFVSFGLLGLGAVVCAVFALQQAFEVAAVFGWSMVVALPILGGLTFWWAIRRLRKASFVPQSGHRDDAGYHHFAEQLGIATGSRGELTTAARPTGRARFAGGECDVQVKGPPLDPGDPVEVIRIEGPVVLVRAARPPEQNEQSGADR